MIGILVLVSLACGQNGCAGAEARRSDPTDRSALWAEPASLVVHPLTRIAGTPGVGGDGGAAALIAHLQLLDSAGLSVRALGGVRVELYRPDPDGEVGSQDLVWEIDLRDPGVNAGAYDELITKTYTLTLGALPEWAIRWARETDTPPPALRARFELLNGRELEATARLGR